MRWKLLVAGSLVVLLAGPLAAQQPPAAEHIIGGVKDLQEKLGLTQTGNFSGQSPSVKAFYRCYYTGKLELPASYDDLRLTQGSEKGCAVDEKQYDVFFYAIEAVANGKAPITESLGEAPAERIAVVVAHEDFHDQKPIQKLPPSIAEAASTLMGFLTAAEYTRKQFGEGSGQHRRLATDAEIFQQKAAIVNRYHAQLRALYASVRSGSLGKAEALPHKQRLFGQLDDECHAALRDATSFNKCLPANNNAGLAFDYTYTKYYPLLYRVFLACDRQLQPTIEAISRAYAGGSPSEKDAVTYFEDLIRRRSPMP